MNTDLTLFWEREGSSVSKKQADLLTVYITKDKKLSKQMHKIFMIKCGKGTRNGIKIS